MGRFTRFTLWSMILVAALISGCAAQSMDPTIANAAVRRYGDELWGQWEMRSAVTLTELRKQQKANLAEILPQLEIALKERQRPEIQSLNDLVAERRGETDRIKQRQAALTDRMDRAEKHTRKLAGIDKPADEPFVRTTVDRLRADLSKEVIASQDELGSLTSEFSEIKTTAGVLTAVTETLKSEVVDLRESMRGFRDVAEIQEIAGRVAANEARSVQELQQPQNLDAQKSISNTKLVGSFVSALLGLAVSWILIKLRTLDHAAREAAEAKAIAQTIRAQFPEMITANVTLETVKAPARRKSKPKSPEPTE